MVTGVGSLLRDKLPADPQNTPQSITVVSAKLLAAQATTRLEDALKNVPGITLNAGEGAARGDTVNLRGFSAFNDFFLDGVRDAAVYTRDSFNLESVEVVKGPSATLFGRGFTGGAINQVSKAPMLTPLQSVTTQFGTNDAYRATSDFDMPLDASAAVRLNAMAESSKTADRDEVVNRRWGVAPSLALGIGQSNSITFAYLHQQENNVPDSGIPFLADRPAPVPRAAFYGLASDRVTAKDAIATIRYRRDFDDNLALIDTIRYANYQFAYLDTMPNYGRNVPTASTPPSDILVGRDAPGSTGTQTNLTDQTELLARFATGVISHTLVTGIEERGGRLVLAGGQCGHDWDPACDPEGSGASTGSDTPSGARARRLAIEQYVDTTNQSAVRRIGALSASLQFRGLRHMTEGIASRHRTEPPDSIHDDPTAVSTRREASNSPGCWRFR